MDVNDFASPLNALPLSLEAPSGSFEGFKRPGRKFTFEPCPANEDLRSFCSFARAGSPLSNALPSPLFPQRATPRRFAFREESPRPAAPAQGEFRVDRAPPSRRRRGNYFAPVIAFLNTYFSQKPCVVDDTFDAAQTRIILSILRRKCGAREPCPAADGEVLEELRAYAAGGRAQASKRTEENNKFVFKHVVKLMKKELAASLPALRAAELEAAFARRYFPTEGAEPQTFARLKTYGSLSLATLRGIFANARLKEDFVRVLTQPSIEQSALIVDYTTVLQKKVAKIFRKWNRKIASAAGEPQVTRELIAYFEANNQCKLPWTVSEIVTAIRCFCDTVLFHAPK